MYFQAIWYTENQGLDGPVFGSADMWNGVGIFFDSFDNDGKVYLLLKLLAIFPFNVFLAVRLWEGSLLHTLNFIKNLVDSLCMVISLGSRESRTESYAVVIFCMLIYSQDEDLALRSCLWFTPCMCLVTEIISVCLRFGQWSQESLGSHGGIQCRAWLALVLNSPVLITFWSGCFPDDILKIKWLRCWNSDSWLGHFKTDGLPFG